MLKRIIKENIKESISYLKYITCHYVIFHQPLIQRGQCNMSSHTKVMMDPNTVQRLSEHDKITNFKDSSSNIVYFNKVHHILGER